MSDASRTDRTEQKAVSIFNHVLGPIMLGPSSSHTAGPHRLSILAKALLGEEAAGAVFAFDPTGSFARVFRRQGSDVGFAAGLLGWELTDRRLGRALEAAEAAGIRIAFSVESLDRADHPNLVEIRLTGRSGGKLTVRAKSLGGGMIELTELDGRPVHLTGDAHEVLIEAGESAEAAALDVAAGDGKLLGPISRGETGGLIRVSRTEPLPAGRLARLRALEGVGRVYTCPAVLFVMPGRPLFSSAAEMVALARERGLSLGRIALAYEAGLLDKSEEEIIAEVLRRYRIMADAVASGLSNEVAAPRLVRPAAGDILAAEAGGKLAVGGLHARAAARAMAVMHVNSTAGLVVAAPTGGSSGVVPGVVVSLAEEGGLSHRQIALTLLAASAVGLIVANRATFAAEVGGCQVEIGVSSAMAAAGVVDLAGGGPAQAADAAAVALQNNMGSVCDPVGGLVEIPCHTRNAVAASSAFVCADLILGGYTNPIPLDETIDAMFAVGEMLPAELKCTALGGLAQTPSARKLI